jgi:hypothetical protein
MSKKCGLRIEENVTQTQGNAPKNIDFSFTKMLQHTGRFWSRTPQHKKKKENTGASPYCPDWLQLIFNCSLD